MFQAGFTLITFKLFLIIAFVFYTSPVVTHALAHACLSHGVEPRLDHPAQDGDEPS
jgi:multicomponent Na+:H+ antiporter subunit G